MADPKRVARALQYQQDKPAWWDAVPVADAPGTVRTPTPQEMSWLNRLNELSAGAGKGIESQLEGYKNMVLHPVDTAQQMYQSGKTVVQDPSLLVKGLQAMGERAMGSPQGFGEVVGENINPRNLLRNLAKPSIEELTVYHGTPHRFPATERNPLGEFDASKIGTGEGAQAYGHGIYVAENPSVAKDYQFMEQNWFDTDKAKYNGKTIQQHYDQATKDQERAWRTKNPALEKDANARLSFWESVMTHVHPEKVVTDALADPTDWPELSAYAKKIDLGKFEGVPNAGNLYHVDLPDPMIEKMLDWDKPLSEQPKSIQDIARQIGAGAAKGPTAAKMKAFIAGAEDPEKGIVATGQDLYRAISDYGGKSVEGSMALREAGIPGIRYLDAGSRDAATGTRNFVIFPGEEKNLKILERK